MAEPTAKQKEEARELATKIMNQVAVGAWQFCSREWNIENCAKEITQSLSSRDVEVREVLEGLRYRHGCWCDLPPNITSPDHTCECDAARGLWERVQS